MALPDNVIAAARAALDGNLTSIIDQIAALDCALWDLVTADAALARQIVSYAAAQILYAERGKLNVQIDARARTTRPAAPGGVNRISWLASDVGERASARTLFNLSIGGRRLGDVVGADILTLAAGEDERARGHAQNGELLRWCAAQNVPADKTIQSHIAEDKLRAAYLRIQRKSASKTG